MLRKFCWLLDPGMRRKGADGNSAGWSSSAPSSLWRGRASLSSPGVDQRLSSGMSRANCSMVGMTISGWSQWAWLMPMLTR